MFNRRPCGEFVFSIFLCTKGIACAECDWFYSITDEGQCANTCIFDMAHCDQKWLVDTIALFDGQCEGIGYTMIDDTVDVDAGELLSIF